MKNNLQNSNRKNAGFTLLELVVVIAVMGLISSMAMDVYTDNSNQKRFEATKERLAEIKFAIIGDPMMRIGSQAVPTGFFKDMGRYPRNLQELIGANLDDLCIDSNFVATVSTQAACTNTWIEADADLDSINDLWKGPYLHNIQSINNNQVFGDVWGRDDGSDTDNFGWIFSITTGDLIVESYGLDRVNNGSSYDADQAITISKTELDSIVVLQALPAATSPSYCIDTTSSAINFSYTDTAACTAVLNHIWVVFP